ncbi:hypothetical protein [Massilia sp. Se16.2.3]|uniref:hypothetical protein n=1 Tax=Massilia sp. Se16.2.3 TaxID=2709303 RepID=UPI002805AD29|nr:hypothetical protein [Massilia sp. Se16.2.3]
MRQPTLLALAASTALLLSGCQSTPPHATYDKIKQEVATAGAAGRGAAPADDAVANALLPPAAALAGNYRRPARPWRSASTSPSTTCRRSTSSARSWPAPATTCWSIPTWPAPSAPT